MPLVVCVSVKAVTPVVGGTSSLTDGDSASLTCTTASSLSSGVTYEWFLGGVAISGATSSPYTTAVSMSDDGNVYTCKVIFNGVTSDVSSNTVTLTGERKSRFHVCVCVCVCVWGGGGGPVGDGENEMAVKSLGTGHCGRTRTRRRCVDRVRWKVAGCSGSLAPEVVP